MSRSGDLRANRCISSSVSIGGRESAKNCCRSMAFGFCRRSIAAANESIHCCDGVELLLSIGGRLVVVRDG